MEKQLSQLQIPGPSGTGIPIQAPDGIPTGGENTLMTIISVGIQVFLIVVIIASLAMLIWAGINWTTSGGDAAKVQAARQQIVYAVIGLAVAFLAFALVFIIGGVLGVKLL